MYTFGKILLSGQFDRAQAIEIASKRSKDILLYFPSVELDFRISSQDSSLFRNKFINFVESLINLILDLVSEGASSIMSIARQILK